MPKVKWGAADADELLSAQDIDEAQDSFTPYTGAIPPGGVYRFRLKRVKKVSFSTKNQGLKVLCELDGSWKPEHAQFDGCPLWDQVVYTKSSAGFVKAFALAIGATSQDMIKAVVVDAEDVVTSIGPVKLDGENLVYIAVRVGSYNDQARLEIAGTGYIAVDKISQPEGHDADKAKGKKADKAKGKKGKKGKAEDDEAPF